MEINKKYYVIPLDRSKFTQEELLELEEYRQLAIQLKIINRLLQMRICDTKDDKEINKLLECMEVIDQMRCYCDDKLFDRFPQLHDKAVHLFY